MPREVERLHAAYQKPAEGTVTWRLYAAVSPVSEKFHTLVGWATGTESELLAALDGWDVDVDRVRSAVHVLGPSRGLPPGFRPLALPPGNLALGR